MKEEGRETEARGGERGKWGKRKCERKWEVKGRGDEMKEEGRETEARRAERGKGGKRKCERKWEVKGRGDEMKEEGRETEARGGEGGKGGRGNARKWEVKGMEEKEMKWKGRGEQGRQGEGDEREVETPPPSIPAYATDSAYESGMTGILPVVRGSRIRRRTCRVTNETFCDR